MISGTDGNTVGDVIKNLVFRKLAPRVATLDELTSLEMMLGVKLPPDFHEFCMRWNGGFPSKENCYYPVPSSCTEYYEKMWFGRKTQGDVVQVDTFFGTCEEDKLFSLIKHYRMCCEGELLRGRTTKPHFIPIADNLMGQGLALRADSPLQKVYWIDSDTYEMPEGIEWGTTFGNPEARLALLPIAESLEEFLNALTSDPDSD